MPPEKEFLSDNRRGRIKLFVERINRQGFQLIRGFENRRRSISAHQINPVVLRDWRRVNALKLFDPLRIDDRLSGVGIEGGENAIVPGKEVKPIFVQER